MSLTSYGTTLTIIGLTISGLSTGATSLNFLITIWIMKTNGMSLANHIVYIWSIYITATMLILVLPILTSALIMVYLDTTYNTIFFDSLFGGDPIYYQHLFWFFGHPEVYVLLLPSFGLISICLSTILHQ